MEIKPLSIVRFKDVYGAEDIHPNSNRFVFLGEIPNMEGHCLLLDVAGYKKFSYYPYFVHLNEIEVIPEDEV